MDMEYSLKGSTASTKAQWYSKHNCNKQDFSQLSELWGNVCGGNGVNTKPYAHLQSDKLTTPLIYVWHGHEMQFELFYSLNQGVLAWFAHMHQVGFQPTFIT
jgi:hypothetical protein